MVSPEQGQLEWIAVVTDVLNDNILDPADLAWQSLVDTEHSQQRLVSISLVMNEVMLTEATIEQPNELFNLLTRGFTLGKSHVFRSLVHLQPLLGR
jgi:hypothetical protein